MNYDSLLTVRNNSDNVIYHFGANSQRWLIKPGELKYIPFEAVILVMGDPRSGPEPIRLVPEGGGIPTFIPSRRDEIKRLSTKHGAYTDDVDAPAAPTEKGNPPEPSLRQRMPNVTVTNMDESDEPIVFPVDDPFCTTYTPMEIDQSQVALLTRQIKTMERQMAAWQATLNQSNGAAPDLSHPSVLNTDAEVDEDSPTPVTRPQARPRPTTATG